MKKILQLFILGILLASCGGGTGDSVDAVLASNDIDAIRAKKTELTQAHEQMEQQMKELDSVIAKLDGSEKLPLVTIFETKNEKFDHFLELQGDVATKQNVLIYPEMAGTLQKVYVKEGQKVYKGQVLGSIDDGGLSSSLAQMETQLALAQTTFERQKKLWDQNIGSEIQFLQAKTSFEGQKSSVAQMKSQLGKTTLTAPFSGIIDDVIKDQGTVVSPGPGSEVFRIVNLNDMYVEVEVPETYLKSIEKGKNADVYFPVLGETVVSKIRQTGNFIDPSNRTFSVEVPVPNKSGNIKPNLSAKVRLNDYTSENAVLIPQAIISENADGEQYVYVAERTEKDGIATIRRQLIETGLPQDDKVEVLKGITANTLLIDEGARTVKDGQNVKILNSEDDE